MAVNMMHNNPVGGWRLKLARRARRGITFTEVMFAVVLLGIGFIMLAGLFAVASQQTLETVEESTATQVAMSARRYLQRLGDDVMVDQMTATVSPRTFWGDTSGTYRPLPDTLWARVANDAIMPQDPRFAWTALYSRRANDQFANLVIFALQIRGKSRFDPADTSRGTLPAYIDPKPVQILGAVKGVNGAADTLTFAAPSYDNTPAATGAYVVIASGPLAGRIYRLGNYVAGVQWELLPGYELTSPNDATMLNGAPAFVVGKGYAATPPANPPTYSGYAMDIGAFTTSVMIKAR